jgi:thiol-disulfide isomerase/thioredoxin
MIRRVRFKFFVVAGILALLTFFPATAWACPLCQDQLSQPWALGFSLSVLFMVSMPFILVGFLGSQVMQAINPRGYEQARARIVSIVRSRWVYAPLLLVAVPLFLFTFDPGSQSRTISLPSAQLVAQTNLNGGPIAPTQLENKIVLVNFFASWCEPCKNEVADLGDLYREYKDQGIDLVGITLDFDHQDEPAAQPHIHSDGVVHFHAQPNQLLILTAFLKSNRASYPVVPIAPEISEPFGGIKAIPATYLFDRRGALVKTYIGPPTLATLHADVQRLLAQK